MREIKINKNYRHFKGNMYKVLHIGINEDNNEEQKVVVYQSNHDGQVFVRNYDNFASKVDKEKYPNATQEYRFEEMD